MTNAVITVAIQGALFAALVLGTASLVSSWRYQRRANRRHPEIDRMARDDR